MSPLVDIIDLTSSSPSPEPPPPMQPAGRQQTQNTTDREQVVYYIDSDEDNDASTLLNQFQSHPAAAAEITGRRRSDSKPQPSSSNYNPGAGAAKQKGEQANLRPGSSATMKRPENTSASQSVYLKSGKAGPFHIGPKHNLKRHADGSFKYGAAKLRGLETNVKSPLISESPVPVRMPPVSTNSATRNSSTPKLQAVSRTKTHALTSHSPIPVRMPPFITDTVTQNRISDLGTSNTSLTPPTSTSVKTSWPPETSTPGSEKPKILPPAQPLASSHQELENHSNHTQEEQSHLATESSFGKEFSFEEDSLLVYLKEGLGQGWQEIATATNGRTGGSCQTRYCKRLKYQLSLHSAITTLESSSFRHVLQPELHPEMLARASTVRQGRASRHITDEDDEENAPGRPRRAAQKRDTYYRREYEEDYPMAEDADDDSVLPSHTAPASCLQLRRSKRIVHQKPPSKLPYLSRNERVALRQGLEGTWSSRQVARWKGTALHFPFTSEEIRVVKNILLDKNAHDSTSLHEQVETIMRSATEAEILEYASIVHEKNVLKDRTKESIEAFFRDAAQGYLDDAILRIGTSMHIQTTKSLLRQRELGYHNTRCHRLSSRGAFMEFRSRTLQTLGPSLSYTGTSGDVNTVAWAPDGVRFAAGSACLVDTASMQYNRPNNLLFGDMAHGTLQELPDHHTRRKKTETGVNATHSMYASQDQRLFQTVSMVDFSPDQEFMYTAGYDKKVRVWDIRNGVKDDPRVMKHKGKVDLLAVSKTGILATGTQRTTKAIKLMGFSRYGDSDILSELKASFSSQKALDRPENEIYPSALRFSPSGEHLLGGFSSSSHDEHVTGETCVWDVGSEKQLPVYPETRTVFDCAWHLLYRTLFAVGCVAGTNVNRGIRSVVRLYDWRADQSRYHRWMELDCEALDMNDIVYSPYDENLVAAGCTNSKTYIWDIRKPDNVMLTLEHGQPLMEFGEPESQEKLDTGIRFASWGHDRSCFYTGSSDGVLKSWNPYRATEDVHNRDIVTLNSGIMSGALSPDFSSLLLGEVNGSVNVLEVGQSDRTLRDMRRLKLMPAYESDPLAQLESTKRVVGEGVTAARDMISSDEITIKPMGSLPVRQAVQGPNYEGPHDKAPDAELLRARALHFQLEAKTTNQEQCEINGCREIDHVTSEEAGDSGRSAERIPGALHFASLSSDGKITGKAKCKKCGALTRPRFAENDSVDTGTLCERCSFACLSCANQAEVLDGATEFVGCTFCGGFWRADVLGYRALEKPKKERSVSVSSSRLRSLYSWGFEDDDETYMGSDCEEEYFQSLWSDRPSSPL